MRQTLLHHADQAVLAMLTAIAAGLLLAWWVLAGGPAGELVEIDHARPLEYQFLVDVNSAGWPELSQLPEIGPLLARRIVDSRAQQGPFRQSADLLRVPGIGQRKLARFQKYLAPLPDDLQTAGR
jgi:competence protein ComEA